MSISVHCGECGKTYQVRDEMAGRRGKCPMGHAIVVPAATPAPAVEAEENAFAFTSNAFAAAGEEPVTPPKSARRPVRPAPVVEPETAVDDFSGFPAQIVGGSAPEAEPAKPRTGRHRKPDGKAGGKEAKPNLMPLILGGMLAVVGLGAGAAMLIVSRGEIGPLREEAEAANKKAAGAEERVQKAEGLKLLAEANLEAAKKNPPRDPAVADLQSKLKAAEKRAVDAEKQLKGVQTAGGSGMPKEDLDPNAPGGKNDPVMPGGKLEADRAMKKEMEKADPKKGPEAKKEMEKTDPKKGPEPKKEMEKADPKKGPDPKKEPAARKEPAGKLPADLPDGVPLGGKTWNAPGAAPFGKDNVKGGDRIWLYPQEDAAPKVVNGKLTIKFRWRLRRGRSLPAKVGVGLVIQEAKQGVLIPGPLTLTGQGGEAEATFDVKDLKGTLPVFLFVGNVESKKPDAHSTMLGFQVDFGAGGK